jgi:hypothetical protein
VFGADECLFRHEEHNEVTLRLCELDAMMNVVVLNVSQIRIREVRARGNFSGRARTGRIKSPMLEKDP